MSPALGRSGQVRFAVLEVLKGRLDRSELMLWGTLVDTDDYNERPVPYDFVRPSGRRGSCHTEEYRPGAEYLVFLDRPGGRGDYEVGAALAPVNEQLHVGEDPWLDWVRAEIGLSPSSLK
jgi:hypothetical protein